MRTYIDSSAFIAVINAEDDDHDAAHRVWLNLVQDGISLVTCNYVVLETTALLQRRLGLASVRTFNDDILPIVTIEWVNESTHNNSMNLVLASNRRNLSLVDCTGFWLMRQLGMRRAFTFDPHFKEQGFECLP